VCEYTGLMSQPQQANWYPDPQNPIQLRYFDGNQWTQHTQPTPSTIVPAQPQPTRKEEKRKLTCPKCGSGAIIIQPVTETTTKNRGCIGWTLWILLAICTIGLIIIIPAITNSKTKSTTTTQAVCQNCGYRWTV